MSRRLVLGREDVRAARQVLLDDVVLGRAGEQLRVDAALAGQRDVQRQQPHGRAVDRHRRVHLLDRDAVEQHVQVVERVDRHADLADLGPRDAGRPSRSRTASPDRTRSTGPVCPLPRFAR